MQKHSTFLKYVIMIMLLGVVVTIGIGLRQHENVPFFFSGFFALAALVLTMRLKRVEADEAIIQSVEPELIVGPEQD